MKTTHSFLKRTCLFLALFCWLTPTNLMADVTAEWGGTEALPYSGAPITKESKIKLSTDMGYDYGWFTTTNYFYQINPGNYVDIDLLDDGWNISQVAISIVYDPGNTSLSQNVTKIQFCSATPYNSSFNIGSPFSITGPRAFPEVPCEISSVPSGAKSARVYTDDSQWGQDLFRFVVTITEAAACANSVDAYFAKESDETGEVPVTINSCEGNNINIPNQGSLVKAGYDFVGWEYNSTTYAPGASFTMPATDVTFTAVWTEHFVPAVTGLGSNVIDNDVTLTWTNYNKLEMTTSNVAIEGFSDGHSMSFTINNGVLECEYEIGWGWGYKSVEIRLPRERNHVTSIDLKYTFNDPNCTSAGGIIPYMMYDGYESGHENNWTSYYSSTLTSGVSEFTDYTIEPPLNILWGSGSGSYDDQWLIHKVGIAANPPVASSGTFSIKDIYINTSDGQTLLDEVIVVRKQGSAPASVTDGTQVYAGLLNTCSDNDLADGDYYYAVFAREGDAYSAAVVEQVNIGAPSLTYYERAVTPGEYGTVCIGYAVEHENISGATMYEIDSWSADGKALTLSELGDSESMVAGRPYIFYATGNLLSLGYDGSAAEASVGSHNGLIGSYSQAEITANDDNYIIYQNKLWLVDVLAYVGEHRAYIHKTNASPAPGRRQIRLFVAGTEVATGLDQINGTCPNGKFIQDGQLFIRRDGRTYNAQGELVK